jgi:C_GCAxxG_C_C family probable redox protein
VLLALAEQQGIRSDAIPRIATGFCGGISRTGNLCGAVSGGVMGISLAFGRNTPDESRDQVFATVQRFLAAFEARFGSLTCLGLTGCHLGTAEGRARFHAEGRGSECRSYVKEAAGMAGRLIEAAHTGRADESN